MRRREAGEELQEEMVGGAGMPMGLCRVYRLLKGLHLDCVRWECQRAEHRWWTLYNIFYEDHPASVLPRDQVEAILIIQLKDHGGLNENDGKGRGERCLNMHIF